MQNSNPVLGVVCALGVICIWSSFIVFSRAGVTTALTAYDITALRLIVAGLATLPFAYWWWPRHLPVKVQALLSLSGPGVIYSTMMYHGLGEASAAYGGVFANGSLPIFTALFAFLVWQVVPSTREFIAIAVIVTGAVLLGIPGMRAGGANVAAGIVLFLSASATVCAYTLGIRHYKITPKQALALVNVPNALVFLPIWYAFLPSGMAETDIQTVIFQALFQGLGPGFLALILYTLSTIHLGAGPTAAFSAAVPASAAVLAIPVLSEVPTTLEWIGVATVTCGLALLVLKTHRGKA
ncbi:MAG: DMT family transporter [Hyphomicrobiales bacterium]